MVICLYFIHNNINYFNFRNKEISFSALDSMPGTSRELPSTTSQILNNLSEKLYLFVENEACATASADEMIAVRVLLNLQNLLERQGKATHVFSRDLQTQHIIKADELTNLQVKSLTGLKSLSLLN